MSMDKIPGVIEAFRKLSSRSREVALFALIAELYAATKGVTAAGDACEWAIEWAKGFAE